jgi:repressor LexA
VTVKYFRKPADDMVVLEPANDDFNDIEINLRNEDFFIEGKYVGLIREN